MSEKDKFFLKAFLVDKNNRPHVTESTPLLPFYGRAKSNSDVDFLGQKRDTVFPGSGKTRYFGIFDNPEGFGKFDYDYVNKLFKKPEKGVYKLGKDEKHAASGLGYNYGTSLLSYPSVFGKKKADYMMAAVKHDNVLDEDFARARQHENLVEQLRTILTVGKTMEDSEHHDKKPALMLMKTDEDGLVKLEDLYDNWDAWRDSGGEVQVKYQMPIAEIPWRDYIQNDGSIDYDNIIFDWAPYEIDGRKPTASDISLKDILSDEQMKDLCREANCLLKNRRIVEGLLPGLR